jgi:DNA-binding transcriptional MerR regulator
LRSSDFDRRLDNAHRRGGRGRRASQERDSLLRGDRLLPAAERVSGRRVYDRSILRRLSLIDVSQRAGLTLEEIRELLDAGTAPISEQLQELAARKLPDVEALIARAEAMRDWLRAAEGCSCQAIDECGLFDAEEVRDAKPGDLAVIRPVAAS